MRRLRSRPAARDHLLHCMQLATLALTLAGTIACSGSRGPAPSATPGGSRSVADSSVRKAAARTAASMVGAPYRYGGASPAGFDCSGLVVYSYTAAGVPGLPHSAAGLERATRSVSLSELEPGDLLFFRLAEKKTSHVAMYVGNRAFVHAPSKGKRVERVGFDHVFWAARLRRAGRLGP